MWLVWEKEVVYTGLRWEKLERQKHPENVLVKDKRREVLEKTANFHIP